MIFILTFISLFIYLSKKFFLAYFSLTIFNSVFLSFFFSISLSFYLSIYLSGKLSTYLSICLRLNLNHNPLLGLDILDIFLSISSSIYLSIYTYDFYSYFHLSVYLSFKKILSSLLFSNYL